MFEQSFEKSKKDEEMESLTLFKSLKEAVQQAQNLEELKVRLAEINGGRQKTGLELRLSAHSPIIDEDNPDVVKAIQGYQAALAEKLDQCGVPETDTLIPEENKN